jgi:hypothetical protein
VKCQDQEIEALLEYSALNNLIGTFSQQRKGKNMILLVGQVIPALNSFTSTSLYLEIIWIHELEATRIDSILRH